ncbi:MAG: phage holin family protein [Burkholderiaceae bacterium]|nr:phage holin family protein [Burkholderiaceae bacterium]
MPGPGADRGAAHAVGLFGSLRRLLASLLEIAQVRLDLLSTEFQREKLRIFDGLIWAALAQIFLGVGLVLLAGLLVALAPQHWRLLVLGLLALLSLGLGVWMVAKARRQLSSPDGLLPASRAELARDLGAVRPPE